MLRRIKDLHGDVLHARDGEIGSVDDVLFDDEQWTVRYLSISTGSWLFGRKVLIARAALGALNWDRHFLNVDLTRDQVKNSPDVDTNKPVSRQWETDYHDYYGLPYYWGGMGTRWGMGMTGIGMGAVTPWFTPSLSNSTDPEPRKDPGDAHLRSSKEVTGYGIAARDGHLGHVDDFIFDDATWWLRYLAVDTQDWWPGKKVLLPLDWIREVSWPERTVTVEVTRDQVRNGPEWDPREPISPILEEEVAAYYGRQRLMASAGRTQACAGLEESRR